MASEKARRLESALTWCAAAAFITMAGCGDHQGAKAGSQVAARVDSYEITTYQLNNALARVSQAGATDSDATRQRVLDTLVNQQLAVRQAQLHRLDRAPAVVSAIEDAKREILARAYYEQIAAAQPKPSDAEIKSYYDAHPELFAERRLYAVKEISVAGTPEVEPKVQQFLASGKPIEQLAQLLQDNHIKFSANAATRPPESMPLDLLPRLAQVKDGGFVVMKTDSGLYVAQVMSSQSAPIRLEDAQSSIRRFLANQRAKSAIDAEAARLRAAAKIEYSSDFAAASSKESDAHPTATEGPPDAETVKRGISGLR